MVYNIKKAFFKSCETLYFYGMEKSMNICEFVNGVTSGAFDSCFRLLYGRSDVSGFLYHRARYINAAEHFSRLYPDCGELRIFSVPKETAVISGNPQQGVYLSASAGSDIAAFVSENGDGMIRVADESGEIAEFPADKPEILKKEQGTLIALVKSIAAEIPLDAGISCYIFPEITNESKSAAAILIASVLNAYSSGEKTSEELAVIAAGADDLRAECCLTDILGGFALKGKEGSEIDCIPFDMETAGYTMCVADMCRSSIMPPTCILAEFSDEELFFAELPELKKKFSDDELLSSLDFLGESRRAVQSAEALKKGDTEGFFEIINESSVFFADHRSALAYTIGRGFLGGSGALKINAEGRLLAFVPNYTAERFCEEMNRIFGEGFCRTMKLRAVGIYELKF